MRQGFQILRLFARDERDENCLRRSDYARINLVNGEVCLADVYLRDASRIICIKAVKTVKPTDNRKHMILAWFEVEISLTVRDAKNYEKCISGCSSCSNSGRSGRYVAVTRDVSSILRVTTLSLSLSLSLSLYLSLSFSFSFSQPGTCSANTPAALLTARGRFCDWSRECELQSKGHETDMYSASARHTNSTVECCDEVHRHVPTVNWPACLCYEADYTSLARLKRHICTRQAQWGEGNFGNAGESFPRN